MAEIRSNSIQFEPRFETTWLGNFFGIGFKTN